MQFLTDVINNLELNETNSHIVIIALLIVYGAVLLLRIIVTMRMRGILAKFYLNTSKIKIKTKADLELFKSGPTARAVKRFIELSEKGIAITNVQQIVEREYSKLSMFYWSFSSVERLVESLESSLLLITVIFALFLENKVEIAAAGIFIFAADKVISSFFDFRIVRNNLVNAVSSYIELNAGKFYASSVVTSINMLRSDMALAVKTQADYLKEATAATSGALIEVTKLAVGELSESVNNTYSGFDEYFGRYEASMSKWQQALEQGSAVQRLMNTSAEKLISAQDIGHKNYEKISQALDSFSGKLEKQGSVLSKLSDRLENAINSLTESNAEAELKNGAFMEQLNLVKENQRLLESSIAHYEVTLGEITKEMGDAFGRIVDYHVKSSYDALALELKEHIKQVSASNSELLSRLQDLFDRLREQSRAEAMTLLSIKEQMDIQFEEMSKKK